MNRTASLILLAVLVPMGLPAPATAGQADLYGVGAAAMGRGNGGGCLENEAASLFYNPAALGMTPFDTFSLGGQVAFPSLPDVDGATWTDGREGRVMQDAISPHGFHIGLVKRIAPPVRFGLAYTHPYQGFFYYEQEDPYAPTMVRWRNRAHRMALYAGASVAPIEGLYIGVAAEVSVGARLHISYAWEGYEGELSGGEPVSLANLREAEVQIRPVARPILGVMADFGLLADRLRGLRLGVTYRGTIDLTLDPTELEMELTNPGALEFIFQATTKVRATAVLTMVDFYTPRQVTISLAWDRPRFAAYADVTWNQYSRMIPNAGTLTEGREGEGGMEVHWAHDGSVSGYGVIDGRLIPRDMFRDTWTVRAGTEVRIGIGPDTVQGRRRGVTVRLGGGYDPAVVLPQAGPTNLIDSPVVSVNAGAGLFGPDPLGLLAGNGSIDLALGVHRALPVTYDKDSTLVPDGVVMPVQTEEQVSWSGGWMVVVGLTGTLRY